MATATQNQTIKNTIDDSNLNQLASALQKAKLGTILKGKKVTLSGLSAAASFDITTIDDPDITDEKLPAILSLNVLRVTAGAAAAGRRDISDAADTPSATLATLSDDGKTITFEGNVTAFIAHYVPAPAEDLDNDFLNE